ncbi:MAG TPA: hypothetical protein VNV14_07510, partial [Opitutaceae bacterium]|nr:hypothetical protein [Opitutaceae bacterium]
MSTSKKLPVSTFVFFLVVGLALLSTCIALYNLEATSQRTSLLVISAISFGLVVVVGWLFSAHRRAETHLHEITAL